MFEKLREIICEYVEVPEEAVTEDARFIEDLGFTSFDFMSMLGEIEDEWDVEIDQDKAVNPAVEDKDWHSMSVPNFWNPIRIWLHGETFGSEHYPKGVSDTYFQQETERCENYTFEYGKVKAAWYRQWIELPESIEGKQIELHFDAVSKVADVFINGKTIEKCRCCVHSHCPQLKSFGRIKNEIV